MIKKFFNFLSYCKIELTNYVDESWMTYRRGEGEDEIENQGRSNAISFSQEAVARCQRCQPRMGKWQTLKRLKRRMRLSQNHLPFFVFNLMSAKRLKKFADSTILVGSFQ